MILSLVAIVVVLLLVIGLHESGHALAAKLCGVKVQRISIGFGPALFRWTRRGCEWVWALFPFGGFVSLLNSRNQSVNQADYPYCFDKKPISARIFILFAGVFVNLIVCLILLTAFYMLGYTQKMPIIQSVTPQSIAAKAALQPRDRFLEIAGKQTESWDDVVSQLLTHLGKTNVPATILHSNNVQQTVTLNLREALTVKKKSLFDALGIVPSQLKQDEISIAGQTLPAALIKALSTSWNWFWLFVILIKQLITFTVPFSMLLGPISIFSLSISSFHAGLSVFLYFVAYLSLAVGFFNLLPIPSLDGGSILLTLIEKCRGRPVSVAFEVLLNRLVMIILIIFLIQLTLNDIPRVFNVSSM